MDHLFQPQLLALPQLQLLALDLPSFQNFPSPRPRHLSQIEILAAYFLHRHLITAVVLPLPQLLPLAVVLAMLLTQAQAVEAQAITVTVSLASQVIVTKLIQVLLPVLHRIHAKPRIGFVLVAAFGILKSCW